MHDVYFGCVECGGRCWFAVVAQCGRADGRVVARYARAQRDHVRA